MHNDIVNPFRVGILQYYKRAWNMHDLAKFMRPPSKKGGDYDQVY